MDDYFRRFDKKDETWRRWVREGKKTNAEYKKWRTDQLAIGERWEALKDKLAYEYVHADQIAYSIIRGHMPGVYAINHNWATYEVEHGLLVDTSYTLYDAETVERIMRDHPDLLPPPGRRTSQKIAEGRALRWNKEQIQSAMMQSILQGDSISGIATRLEAVGVSYTIADIRNRSQKTAEQIARELAKKNRNAAIRNARTMTTGAQNAGRVDAYRRCENMGIKLGQQWLATLDSRTRHSHRQMDGEVVKVGEEFSNGCRFPGDPSGDPWEIYNCRCTLIASLEGFEDDAADLSLRRSENLGGMSYQEWKNSHVVTSNPIDLPEKKANAFKWSYINEYRSL